MHLELKNKVVLVSGASQGIGYTTALAFAREGAYVAICSSNNNSIEEVALAENNILVNSLLTGWTRTQRVAELMQNQAKKEHLRLEDVYAKKQKIIPLGMASPEEIVDPIVFLSSAAASFITGMTITADGRESRFPF